VRTLTGRGTFESSKVSDRALLIFLLLFCCAISLGLLTPLAGVFVKPGLLLAAAGGLVVLVPVTFLLFKRLDWALVLLIFYTSIHTLIANQYVGASRWGSGTSFSAVGAIKDLFLLLVLGMWLLRISLGRKYRVKNNLLTLPLLVFVALGAVYSLRSVDLKVGLWGFRSLAQFIAVFFLTAGIVRSRVILWRLSLAILVSGLFISALGFYELLGTQIGYGYEFGVLPEHIVGRVTVFGDEHTAGTFGTYMSILVTFSWGLILFLKRYSASAWFKLLLFSVMALAGINTVFTFSRRAWVGVLCSAVIFLFLTKRIKVVLQITTVVIAALILGLVVHPRALSILVDRVTIVDPTHLTNAQRLEEWSVLWQRVNEHFLLGEGLGVVGPVSTTFNVPGGTNTHNYYLMLLVEMGFLGLLSFLIIVGLIYFIGIRAFESTSDGFVKAVSAGAFATVINLAVQAFFSVVIENYPFNLYFWFFTGLLVSIVHLARRDAAVKCLKQQSLAT